MVLHAKQGRGISFSKRDTPPLDPPRENSIGSLDLEEVRRLGSGSALRGGIAALAAIGGARRFAYAPIIRCCAAVGSFAALRMRHTPCGCRSAYLPSVQTNFLLSTVQAFSVVRTAASAVLPPSANSANKRGERSNAASVGTCKSDEIQSRRKLRKAAESQAERQRVVEVGQIV